MRWRDQIRVEYKYIEYLRVMITYYVRRVRKQFELERISVTRLDDFLKVLGNKILEKKPN